jgi:CcmD family protein
MDARNFTFMFYGFTAAWLIVLLYVMSLARRNARLKKELEDVKQLVKAEGGAQRNWASDQVR